jgi:mannosyltransferase
MLLGLSLRLHGLNAEGLWLDEGGSVMKADADLKQFMSGRQPYISPPFYYLLLGSWMKLFGTSEIFIRFPSVLFGTLSILMLYLIGKILFDNSSGLIAAFLITISPFQIYFSQEARMYSLLLFLSLCSMYFFIDLVMHGAVINRGKAKKIKWGSSCLYVLSSILLLYTHNFGISPLIAQNIFVLCLLFKTRRIGRMELKGWVFLQSILLLAFLPWIIVIIKQFLNIQGNYWSPPPSLKTLLETLLDYSGSYWLLGILVSFSFLAWFILHSNRRDRQSLVISVHRDGNSFPIFLFLFICLLTPLLLPFFISIISTPIYISRITITASPALYLMAGAGIGRLRKPGLRIASLSLIGMLSLPLLWNYYHSTHKEPLREVISQIEAKVKPGDIILIMPLWYKKFVFDYYQTRHDIPVRGFTNGNITKENIQELVDLTEQYQRIWIILCHENDITPVLEEEFPIRFNPLESIITYYFNFQARKYIAIRVYLLRANQKFKD